MVQDAISCELQAAEPVAWLRPKLISFFFFLLRPAVVEMFRILPSDLPPVWQPLYFIEWNIDAEGSTIG